VPTSVDPNEYYYSEIATISLKNEGKEGLLFITFVKSEYWGYGIPLFSFILFDVNPKHQTLFSFIIL